MEKKFNVGDYARRVLDGAILRIDVIKDDWIAYRDKRIMTGVCPLEEVEPIDSKTAFLSELKDLLAKYGGKMSADVSGLDLDCAEIDVLFLIGNDEIRFDVSMFDSFITPDNIIESACYDKE